MKRSRRRRRKRHQSILYGRERGGFSEEAEVVDGDCLREEQLQGVQHAEAGAEDGHECNCRGGGRGWIGISQGCFSLWISARFVSVQNGNEVSGSGGGGFGEIFGEKRER